jgi:hypothetical protein
VLSGVARIADLVGTDLRADHTVIDTGHHRLPNGTISVASRMTTIGALDIENEQTSVLYILVLIGQADQTLASLWGDVGQAGRPAHVLFKR